MKEEGEQQAEGEAKNQRRMTNQNMTLIQINERTLKKEQQKE